MASKGQQAIFDTLLEKPRTINQLMEVTYLSDSFVRNTIRFMEQTGQVEKIDDRVPYVYKIAENSTAVKEIRIAEDYKKNIMAGKASDPIEKMLASIPKSTWLTAAMGMRAMSKAIEELNAEGKLIETL